jgi:hypothetical protein
MKHSHKVGTVEVKNLVDSRMSRCLFGDWPRRKLLKPDPRRLREGTVLLEPAGKASQNYSGSRIRSRTVERKRYW